MANAPFPGTVVLTTADWRTDTHGYILEVDRVRAQLGKRISEVQLTLDVLHVFFEDGTKLSLEDGGQSCCESRYMTCDDDLSQYIGAELLSVEVKDGPGIDKGLDGDCHDVQFLELRTSRGPITCASHNEHNGYYGGFDITARVTTGHNS